MKKLVAIITDIHGNLEALEAILKDIKTQEIDEVICLMRYNRYWTKFKRMYRFINGK